MYKLVAETHNKSTVELINARFMPIVEFKNTLVQDNFKSIVILRYDESKKQFDTYYEVKV